MDNHSGQQTTASLRRRPPAMWLALVALVAGFALVAGACKDSGSSKSDDDSNSASESAGAAESSSDDDSDTGAADSGESGSQDPDSDSGDSAVDPAAALEKLEAATTSCEVLESMDSVFAAEEPQDAEQAREFVDGFVAVVNKMAETTSDDALAQQLETAAKNLRQFAEDGNYDPAAMNFSGQPDYPGAEDDFAAVDAWYNAEFPNCVPDDAAIPTP